MIDMKLDTVKEMFFDREKVEKAVGAGSKRALSRVGAFTRQRAITLILRHVVRKGFGVKSKTSNRDGISPVGQPPFSHEGSFVKNIFFGWDAGTESMVVGPIRLNKKGDAPRVLDKGGAITQADSRGRVRAMFYRPRPVMMPAFDLEKDKVPAAFENSIDAR